VIRRFARPYAKAMMELAGTAENSRRMHGELLAFERARASNTKLSSLYENPGVSSDQKLRVTQEIAARLDIDPLGLRLLETLVHHHRINDLDRWSCGSRPTRRFSAASWRKSAARCGTPRCLEN
jgi:F0F1-type ATP synthase delta subunit